MAGQMVSHRNHLSGWVAVLRAASIRNNRRDDADRGFDYENSSDLMTIGTTPGGVITAPTST